MVTWSDGVSQNVSASPASRSVSPASTTNYSVTSLSDHYCSGTSSGIVTVTVSTLAAPANFSATTVQNNTLVVSLQWSAVSGAQWYQVERATFVNGPYTAVGPHVTATSSSDSFGLTSPVTYLYRVRAGFTSNGVDSYFNPSAIDYATVATALFTNEPMVPGQTVIAGAHIGQLRQAVDAVRVAAGLAPTWSSYAAATGLIQASDLATIRQKLNEATTILVGHGVFYTGVAPVSQGFIYAYQFQQTRDGVR